MIKKSFAKSKIGSDNKRRYFREAWEYLKESKVEIFIILGVFVLGIALGFIFPGELSFFNGELVKIAKQVENMGTLEITWFIFQNNLMTSAKGIFLGAIFGFMPVFFALFNGAIIGYVAFLVNKSDGILALWRILPHGIFELPAVFISLGMGLRFGTFIFAKKKGEEFKRRFYKSLIVLFLIVLPLLLIAAIIEGLLIYLMG